MICWRGKWFSDHLYSPSLQRSEGCRCWSCRHWAGTERTDICRCFADRDGHMRNQLEQVGAADTLSTSQVSLSAP
jgi:hypothetical protein